MLPRAEPSPSGTVRDGSRTLRPFVERRGRQCIAARVTDAPLDVRKIRTSGLGNHTLRTDYIVVSMLTVRAPGRRGASESSFARGLVRNVRLAERKQFPPRNQVPDASLEDVQ